jgi:hypothetical protein
MGCCGIGPSILEALEAGATLAGGLLITFAE